MLGLVSEISVWVHRKKQAHLSKKLLHDSLKTMRTAISNCSIKTKIMKTTKLSILLFFGLFTETLHAQSLNLSGGFTSSTFRQAASEEYSYTYNSVDGTETESAKMKRLSGFNAGLSFEFKLNKTFSLEPGLRYQTRGFNYNELEKRVSGGINVYTNNMDFTYQENYFDLPLVLNAGTDFGNFRVYGRAGFYGGLLYSVHLREKREIWDAFFNELITWDESVLIKGEELDARFTVGYLLGVGVTYKGFYLEANYNNGLLMPEDFGLSSDFSLNLGYKFRLRR